MDHQASDWMDRPESQGHSHQQCRHDQKHHGSNQDDVRAGRGASQEELRVPTEEIQERLAEREGEQYPDGDRHVQRSEPPGSFDPQTQPAREPA